MKVFWDTSAAINALVSDSVSSRLKSDSHLANPHLIFEFFAIITGRGIAVKDADGNPARLVLSADDAVAWLMQFSEIVRFVELSPAEILAGLKQAGKKGVQGGRVYDYGHAMSTDKAKAEILLTRNADDFAGLTNAKAEWP